MIYDENKSVSTFMPISEGPKIVRLVRTKGVMGGIKAYFYAQREGDHLRIFTDKVAPPQIW